MWPTFAGAAALRKSSDALSGRPHPGGTQSYLLPFFYMFSTSHLHNRPVQLVELIAANLTLPGCYSQIADRRSSHWRSQPSDPSGSFQGAARCERQRRQK
jgi:hypothetical protein